MDDIRLGFFIHNFRYSSFDLILYNAAILREVDSVNLSIFDDLIYNFQGVVNV